MFSIGSGMANSNQKDRKKEMSKNYVPKLVPYILAESGISQLAS
jgi:hypothetical protein